MRKILLFITITICKKIQDHHCLDHGDADHDNLCLLQSRMAGGHGLGLFMAVIFLSGEMAGVSFLRWYDGYTIRLLW